MASVRVAEYGGKVEVSQTRNFHPTQTIRVDLISLTEKALNDAGKNQTLNSCNYYPSTL